MSKNSAKAQYEQAVIFNNYIKWFYKDKRKARRERLEAAREKRMRSYFG